MRKKLILALLLLLIFIPLGVAHADKPFEFTDQILNFPFPNPCTGDFHLVNFNINFRLHSHDGREVLIGKRTITTNDGFVGRGTSAGIINNNIGKFTMNDMLVNEAGDRIKVHVVTVVELPSWTPRVDQFSSTCHAK